MTLQQLVSALQVLLWFGWGQKKLIQKRCKCKKEKREEVGFQKGIQAGLEPTWPPVTKNTAQHLQEKTKEETERNDYTDGI